MMYSSSIFSFVSVVLSVAVATITTIVSVSVVVVEVVSANELMKETEVPYVFDRDQGGPACKREYENIKEQDDGDDERFKLYCVNTVESFRQCSMTCSDALKFEGSSGSCKKDTNCNFYDMVFQEQTTGDDIKMKDVAKNKATLVAVVPLWKAQAQYFYELLEEVRKRYGDDQTAAFVMPMELDVDNPWEEEEVVIDTYHTQRVTVLNNTHPERFGSNPLMQFLTKLRYKSGFKFFDVYTDRPVLFMISPDGTNVERLVIPKYDDIQSVLTDTFGLHQRETSSAEL
mmetsp:Transcript_23044/g.54689  ORF Transcript_23044/g.54689 Transcript_23044/m.54689 type:complete len:286 (-) Transcript_23044:83-940(-)|eukprot:CAMPEP_0113461250 /NCGR_PEP_ID=MMETSP0014_2-20120614/11438_1 /TAXON_ID=2857 /ORGANISM="Nitzschia sp." /LENGTH=285 /DNA_ID=CAMNT_0000352993 /DNA_START=127 /DNA_END=984 /DNA_ORIENTATION=+ /assembly_acc=CAM_ASM_000159